MERLHSHDDGVPPKIIKEGWYRFALQPNRRPGGLAITNRPRSARPTQCNQCHITRDMPGSLAFGQLEKPGIALFASQFAGLTLSNTRQNEANRIQGSRRSPKRIKTPPVR